jgi:pyruvate/2-oxoacid:ferredoxin oxidoreductase beta subunit/Pyruvate/2-oxoacid:ferredoxin oxidoreductase delta subunit
MVDTLDLTKEAGEPKELHEARLTRALPMFDVQSYVAEFGATIVPEYRTGQADRGHPADIGLARSIIPAATAATRDFSTLSPRIPELIADACVGCMACVNACPDTAILATVQPKAALEAAVTSAAAGTAEAAVLTASLNGQFAVTQKYATVPERKGLEPGMFGLFVDPLHCKGCGECVEVCAHLGHDALVMVDKQPATATAPSTIDTYQERMSFFRSLPPTPVMYRNEKALADLMLGEHALGYVGGAGSCSGCGEATALRMLAAATRQVYGPDSMGMVAATGCNTVYGSTYPYNPWVIPWTNSLFENAATDAMGIRARWDQAGHPERRLWAVGGDGGMYDIGFQALSRMVASGADIKVMVLDTQAYSNTGGQASTASFGGQITKLSAYGRSLHGRPERRKELGRILMAHGDVYVAQTTTAHINHFYRAVMEANEYPGPAVLVVYTPCQPEHGIGDDASAAHARMAVDSRAFPLFIYDPRRGDTLAERLTLQGNPALREDWAQQPDGSIFDFTAFARTEGRFAPHFGADGAVSDEIQATSQDRLANWRMLQEMAGIGPNRTQAGA